MRTTHLIIVLIALTATFVNAQNTTQFSFHSGLAISKLKTIKTATEVNAFAKNDTLTFSHRLGFRYQFNYTPINTKFFAFDLGLGFRQAGGMKKINGEMDTLKVNYSIDYFDVNPTLHLKIPVGKSTPSLYAGPRLDVATNYDSMFLLQKKNFKPLSFGWNAGAGLDVHFSKFDLSFNYQFMAPFTKINKKLSAEDAAMETFLYSIKTSTQAVTLGFKFNL